MIPRTGKTLAAFLLAAATSFAAETPATPSPAQLELRANTAFNSGNYNTALPILKKLAETVRNDPARLDPLNEKIRVCERSLAALAASPATQPSAFAGVIARETRKPHPAPRPGEILELGITDLGNFDYDQEHGGNIPADVRLLNGAKIRLRGFMMPLDQAVNITQFELVQSFNCCGFGQPPRIQHTIIVDCPKGKAVGYFNDQIIVEGTLKVEEKKDDGYIVSIFGLDVTSVKPAPK